MVAGESAASNLVNLVSLAIIQGTHALLPLVVFPYALSVVGVQQFSDIVWTEATALIVLAVALYSFDVDAVRQLIGLRSVKDWTRIRLLFISVLLARLLLFTVTSCLLVIGVWVLAPEALIFQVGWLLLVLGTILQSGWFFQGLERNVALAAFAVTFRLASVALIYVLIDTPSEAPYIPLIIGSAYTFTGAFALGYAMISVGMRPVLVGWRDVSGLLEGGRHIFRGNIFVVLFRGSNVILLKWLSFESAVAAYSIAEKGTKSIQAIVRPWNQFAFPKVVRALLRGDTGGRGAISVISRYTMPQLVFVGSVYALGGVAYALTASDLPNVPELQRIVELAIVMALAPFLGVCNFMFGTAGLNTLGFERYYASAITRTGIGTLGLSVFLIILLEDLGAALAFVFGEFLLFLLVFRRLRNVGPLASSRSVNRSI